MRIVPVSLLEVFQAHSESLGLRRRKGGGGGGSSSHSNPAPAPKSAPAPAPKSAPKPAPKTSTSSTAKSPPKTFTTSPAAQPFSVPSGHALAYSSGGGKQFTLGSSTSFSGRQAGGGSRNQVFGTSRYGSGYPYGASGTYLDNRPFPFVFYPVVITPYDYYGSYRYTSLPVGERPGGELMEAIIQPSNDTGDVTFRIVGDNLSVSSVYTALIANCSISNSTAAITPFNASLTTFPFPEQVVQWYRASSFALSLDSYNNSAALLSNMPASNSTPALPLSEDTPLPDSLNMTLLICLNATIGASLPLLDPTRPSLTRPQIAGIVIGCVIGGALIVLLFVHVWHSWRAKRASKQRQPTLTPKDYEKVESRSSLDC